jgi:hypothetical protein
MPLVLDALWRRVVCAVRTSLMHELDFRTGTCRYCDRNWDTLYPPSRRKPHSATDRANASAHDSVLRQA